MRRHDVRLVHRGDTKAFVSKVVVFRQNSELTMTTQSDIDEQLIRYKIGNLVEAVRAMDLARIGTIYVPKLVSFDFEPPLRTLREEAKLKHWAGLFAAYQPPLGYEVRDLTLVVDANTAFGYSLNRISGTLKNGKKVSYWVRWTACFQKLLEGDWGIAHDHVSVPTDIATGKALLDLEP